MSRARKTSAKPPLRTFLCCWEHGRHPKHYLGNIPLDLLKTVAAPNGVNLVYPGRTLNRMRVEPAPMLLVHANDPEMEQIIAAAMRIRGSFPVIIVRLTTQCAIQTPHRIMQEPTHGGIILLNVRNSSLLTDARILSKLIQMAPLQARAIAAGQPPPDVCLNLVRLFTKDIFPLATTTLLLLVECTLIRMRINKLRPHAQSKDCSANARFTGPRRRKSAAEDDTVRDVWAATWTQDYTAQFRLELDRLMPNDSNNTIDLIAVSEWASSINKPIPAISRFSSCALKLREMLRNSFS